MQKKETYIQQKTEFIDILNYINFNIGKARVINILISGPPGIGKTFLCEKIAEELGCSYRDITGHPGLTREDLEGVPELKNGTSSWRNGVIPEVIEAANHDGIALFGMHEFNIMRLDVQPSLDSYMDFQGKFNLTTNANMCFIVNEGCTVINIATINENIQGVNPVQDAVLTRFKLKINLKYPTLNQEKKVLQMKTGIKEEFAVEICKFSAELRKATLQDKLTREISTRELIAFADLLRVPGISQKTGFEYTILNKLAQDSKEEDLIHDAEINFGLLQKLQNVQFDDNEQKSTNKKIDDTKYSGKLSVEKNKIYSVNSFPEIIEYENNTYKILGKGEWCPKDQWIAKIVTNENQLELHLRPNTGEKRVIRTGVKFKIE